MKTLLPLIAVCVFSIQLQAQYNIPDAYYFDLIDIDGNTHTLTDYFDAGKSVFVFEFSNDAYSFLEHENMDLAALYNTYGQGGTNEIAVLYIAGYGFDSAASLSNIDYSNELGTGYENVSFLTNNPIPVAVLADNPLSDTLTYKYEQRILCTDLKYTYFYSTTPDEYMNRMYDICCVNNEFFEPGLSNPFSIYTSDCNLQEVDYQIMNGTPVPIDNCNIDVLINGVFTETIVYTGPLAGCETENLTYENMSLEAEDIVTFAVADMNEMTTNDSIDIEIASVDTVRGHFKMEIINAAEQYGYGQFTVGQSNYAFVDQTTNWYNQIFTEDVGCMQIEYLAGKLSGGQNQMLIIASINEDESIQDTILFQEGSALNVDGVKNVYITETAVPYLWGYIFEDIDEETWFFPSLPRISGISVSHGANSTFSNNEGYFQLPISPSDQIQISYDQTVWPISTTPTSVSYNPGNNIYNFGINQNDPVWESDSWIDNGIPFVCDNPLSQEVILSNTGNQPIQHDVTFTHDPLLEVDLANTNPTPTSVSGNELSFEITNTPFGYNEAIQVKYTPASAALLGEYLDTEINITTNDVDGNFISTETITTTDSLFCAYDPNDFYGFPLGEGPTGLIAADTDLDYRIRFQNTGNYPAQTVRVTHFVPEELNWESIVPGPTSHEAQIQMNSDTREMTWVFNNINLPDSTTDYEGSNGHVWYKAEMNDLDPGDEIENIAEIYFDQNEAVITNTSLHTISDVVGIETADTKEIKAYPNPTKDLLNIDLSNVRHAQAYVLFDISGRSVLSGQISGSNLQVDLSKLEPGPYSVLFTSTNKNPIARASVLKIE